LVDLPRAASRQLACSARAISWLRRYPLPL